MDLNQTLCNMTLDCNNWSRDEDNVHSYGLYILFSKGSSTLYFIIFVLGIIGNGLVIWIAGFRMKKTVSAVWFLNLAIADFLCCASLPLRIGLFYFRYLNIDICCFLIIILYNLNMSASVLLLAAMSFDRCISVMWPFWAKVHRTCKLVRITAAIIWILSFILTVLVFYMYMFHLYDLSEWCVVLGQGGHVSNMKQPTKLIRLVLMFVVPFLIIFISYVTIFFKLRNSRRPQRSQRPYRIITAVILCFFICWCPYYIWPLTPMYDGSEIPFFTVHLIVVILASLNSCINPIIYVFMSPDFKRGFFRSIPSRLVRALGEQNDGDMEGEGVPHINMETP
ncbi:chemerin-like receptor 1 [Dendropsophus ebraccatus]|uniref:chemerin-like receptor 1 n=1 Tax=Dendropsophus ebraccatus TaxID=150705 RepID=UPI0038314BC2